MVDVKRTSFVDFKAPVMAMGCPVPRAAKDGDVVAPAFIAAGGGGGQSKTGVLNYITLYAVDTSPSGVAKLEQKHQLKLDDMVTSIAVSANGSLVAAGIGFTPTCKVYNYNPKAKKNPLTERATFDSDFKEEEPSQNAVTFNAAGDSLATGGDDSTVRVWKLTTDAAEQVHAYTGHKKPVNGVSFNPSGTLLLSCSDDDTVKVWSLAAADDAAACVATIGAGVGAVVTKAKGNKKKTKKYGVWKYCAARFSVGGTAIFALETTRRADCPAVLCKWADIGEWAKAGSSAGTTPPEPTLTRVVDRNPVVAMTLSADGELVGLGGSQGKVLVFSTATLDPLHSVVTHGLAVTSLVFADHTNGMCIVSGSADRSIAVSRVQMHGGYAAAKLFVLLVVLVVLVALSFFQVARML